MRIIRRLVNLNGTLAILATLAVLLMEVLWVYPWLAWVGTRMGGQRPPLSLVSLIFLISISFLVTKYFLSRKWSLGWIQLSIVSCGLVAIFIVVRVEYGTDFGLLSGQWFSYVARLLLDSFSHPHIIIIALIAGVYFWWRGISRGRSSMDIDDIYRSFLIGLAALVALIILWGIGPGASSLAGLASAIGLYVAGFFFFGLAALALCNLRDIQEKMLPEEAAQIFSRRWLSILFGIVGGIVLVGIGVASVFSPGFVANFAAALARFLSFTYDLLLQALYFLLIPIGFLVAGLVYVVQFLYNLFRHPVQTFPSENVSASGASETALWEFPVDAILAIKWFIFALIAIAIIILLTKAIFRYQASRAKPEVDEIHESLWSWGGFKSDLGLFFGMIWQRFKRKKKQSSLRSLVPDWYKREGAGGMLSIREIYQHLLWEASRYGIARRSHETPYEYARRLEQVVPDSSKPLGELTNLYIDIRYGDLEAGDKLVSDANSLWKVLQELLGRLEKDQQFS